MLYSVKRDRGLVERTISVRNRSRTSMRSLSELMAIGFLERRYRPEVPSPWISSLT